jgi:uncharacterized membrane protein YqaE (UPF0057 family)
MIYVYLLPRGLFFRFIIFSELRELNISKIIMGCMRVLLAILLPPLAVIDKGCGSIVIVFILTLCGWVPGVIAALIILNNPER